MKQLDRTAIPVVAFDSTYKLVATFSSIKEAAEMTRVTRQSIMKAVYGDAIAVGKHYWRAIPEEFIVDSDDVGKLTLFEFDQSIGIDRKIYSRRAMKRDQIIQESDYIKKYRT